MAGGRIRNTDIETVRERTDIVQLINEYVPLKKSGRQFRGPCPFHKEKDPSFYVDPAKALFHCFGCKVGGNVFDFVMKLEGLKFSEAVERLADRLGYQLTYDAGSEADLKGRLEKDGLFKLNQTATEYYHYLLKESDAGKSARAYLAQRGFGDRIIDEFKIGFAPQGWENLAGFLAKKGFTPADMVTVGLCRERAQGQGSGQGVYDVFRGRVVFPILDHRGRAVAFGGRTLPGQSSDNEPKYLNSPETPIYRKGYTLYGYFQARAAMQDTREAIVVEGYTDLLALRQAEVGGVVATLGTALTENHFDLLARVSDSVYLAFDADRAGIDAARRALEFFNRFPIDVFVVTLPEGEDPASLVEKNGSEAFAVRKERAEPLLDFSLRKIVEGCDTTTAMGRQRAMAACVPVLSRVSVDEFRPVRNELVRLVGGLLDMPEETVEVYMRQAVKSGPSRGRQPGGDARPQAMWDKVENEALQVLLNDPEVLLEQAYLDEDYFTDGGNKKIFEMLKEFVVCDEKDLLAEFDSFVRGMLERLGDDALRARVTRLLMEPVPDCSPGYEHKVFEMLQLNFFKREKRRIEFEISKINPRLEPKKYEALCARLLEIQQVIREQFPYDHS
ncbi:MAG TPA: DNA primase [Candidatus Anoxymicrobiaceae bacterium]